ncbi:MAG: bacterioferritin [Nitrospirales bacterium]|nr:bacterioferritin [Nitrospira sp.]MDR4500344.1 bacterioferritin [Nitrospirales bacterium]
MKAKKGVIDYLNKVLTNELTAINQYFVHGEMCENWGYERLHHAIKGHAIDEMKHAEEMIEHILYLEGVPNMQRLGKISIGETVPEQLKVDLKLEIENLSLLRDAITHCASVGDYTTRQKLEVIAKSEEEHIDWIETQQETVKQVGLENYLSEQIKDKS